jgi:hypothetical protein
VLVVQLPMAHQREQSAYRFTRWLTNLLSLLVEEEVVKLEFVAAV